MAACIDGGPHIQPDDFIIDVSLTPRNNLFKFNFFFTLQYNFSQIVTFDYGMRDRNPIDEVRFYGKNNPDKPMIVRKDEVSD